MAKPDSVIVLRKPDGSVAVLHPVREMRVALFDEDENIIQVGETETEYLDDIRDGAMRSDPGLAGAAEVARAPAAEILPADRADRDKWEYEVTPGAKRVEVNPARVVAQ